MGILRRAGQSRFPGRHFCDAALLIVILAQIFLPALGNIHAQPVQFVARSGDKLVLNGQPFYFLGANAYYLMESAAHGDTAAVKALFSTARALGLGVIRTWGFFDSPDSLNPAVIQYRPGAFNESALRALDFVVYQAQMNNVRLLIPLVNGWDEYGGMNQYVRWRVHYPVAKGDTNQLHDGIRAGQAIVRGPRGQSYLIRIDPLYGHDDFYSDSLIVRWYQTYVAMILQRTNTYTGVQFRNEQAVFGWELANEPRSSDRSGQLISRWTVMTSLLIKSIDQNHLVGTGEEGFDNTGTGYSGDAYAGGSWMFDGSEGISFSTNSAVPMIDFASIHLYPGSWNISNGSGNTWIRDHIQIARSVGKPLVVGEFGVREFKVPTYESWLTTALLDGAAGALVWQLLEGVRSDGEGFGFRCPDDAPLCSVLGTYAAQFDAKSRSGELPTPAAYSLYQNYPNPFNGITTIAYDLPYESFVRLGLYDVLGHRIATLVDGVQQAGSRRELVDVTNRATGAYFYRLMVTPAETGSGQTYSQTRKMLIIK